MGHWHSATMIDHPKIISSAKSIIRHSPHAFSNTMFRPFINDVHGNPMILLSAVENILLIFLLLICLLNINIRKKNIDGFILLNLFFVILLFILIGLITSILGAMMRYRIIALPSLIFLIVYFYDEAKLKRFMWTSEEKI
jgi:hypothetical protein